MFLTITKTVLLLAAIFMGIAHLGTDKNDGTHERCIIAALIYTTALVMLQICCG